jgi:hypothetical protein
MRETFRQTLQRRPDVYPQSRVSAALALRVEDASFNGPQPLAQIADRPEEAATNVSPKVQGTLDGQDHADSYTLWRRPGRLRYELDVRGEGAVNLLLEALRLGSGGKAGTAAGWQVIEERPSVRCGSKLTGMVTVPEVPIDASLKVEWVELRLRISRAIPSKAVEYEFYLDPGDPVPGAPPPDHA